VNPESVMTEHDMMGQSCVFRGASRGEGRREGEGRGKGEGVVIFFACAVVLIAHVLLPFLRAFLVIHALPLSCVRWSKRMIRL
jgi:hypothetical protein